MNIFYRFVNPFFNDYIHENYRGLHLQSQLAYWQRI
jgi:hypothetical protein